MGRLVTPTRIVATRHRNGLEGMAGGDVIAAAPAIVQNADIYLERVAKYVPAEVVAFFIFANAILKQADKSDATMAGFSVANVGMVVFGAWLFRPIYLSRMADADDVWITNAGRWKRRGVRTLRMTSSCL